MITQQDDAEGDQGFRQPGPPAEGTAPHLPEVEPATIDKPQAADVGTALHVEEVNRGGLQGDPTAAQPDGFGEYDLIRKIAQGGMGVVYKARQKKLNRIVALKMIRAGELASADEVRRFYTEAQAVAQLDHPGIVPVFEVGELAGQHYFSMGFVEGGSLAAWVRDKPLPPAEAARLIEQVSRAVAYAHERGVIHRDLKPANILLDQGGQPKVSDFGLARLVQGDSHQTMSGQVMGTPSYMPPEQATGKIDQIGPLADVYSLGATLYCLLTGRPPFQTASVMETLKQVLEQDPVPPRQLNPAVPRDLETICLKCLAKNPAGRYASAAALAEDVRRHLQREPILARPAGNWERWWSWARRRPAVAALVGTSALAALAIVGLVVGLIYNRDLVVARQAEELERQRAEINLEKAETYLYFNRIGMAERNWWTNNVGRTRELLAECPAPRRRWEWHYLDRLCRSTLLELKGHQGEVWSVDWSPDGMYIASGSRDCSVKIWDGQTGRELLTLHRHPSRVHAVRFSPDGRRLAAACGENHQAGEVKVWEITPASDPEKLPAFRELLTLANLTGEECQLAFSADSRRLAVAVGYLLNATEGPVHVYDVAERKKTLTLTTKLESVVGVAFSPDQGRLITCGGRFGFSSTDLSPGVIQVWDSNSGQELQRLQGHAGLVVSVVFSPNGRYLASASSDRTVKLWDASSYREVRTLRGHSSVVRSAAFRMDSKRLATASEDSTVRIWDAASGEEVCTLRGHTAEVNGLAYHPSGDRLVSGGQDKAVYVWDATTSQEARSYRQHAGPVWAAGFSPDGRCVASAADDGFVKLVFLDQDRPAQVLRKDDVPVHQVAFSPCGGFLASAQGDWRKSQQQGAIRVWDLATRQERLLLKAHSAVAWSVVFSPDGKKLASGGGEYNSPGEVKIWDTTTGQALLTLSAPGGVKDLRFSSDGRLLAGVLPPTGILKVWDTGTGKEVLHLAHGQARLWSVAFSPDGRLLASGSGDQTIRLWETATGKLIADLRGHTSDVLKVVFSPDGLRLASAGFDQTIKLWDVALRQEVVTLRGHAGPVWSLAFSADGHRLVSASEDQSVRIWDATPRPETHTLLVRRGQEVTGTALD